MKADDIKDNLAREIADAFERTWKEAPSLPFTPARAIAKRWFAEGFLAALTRSAREDDETLKGEPAK